MFRLIYWSATVPQALSLLFREIKQVAPNTTLCLQIDPDEKTVHFSEVRPDEVIRARNTDFSQLKKWVSLTREQKTVLVIDCWGIIASLNFEKHLKELLEICAEIDSVVFVSPELHAGYWRFEEIFAEADAATKTIFETLFARVKSIYDAVLNLKTKSFIVASTPTLRLMEVFLDRPQLKPNKTLGFQWLPKDCQKHEATFSSAPFVVKNILTHLGLIVNKNDLYWAQPIDSDVKYVAGQTFEHIKSAPPSGFLLSSSWGRFVGNINANTPIEFRELSKGIGKRWQIAKWFYFLATLDVVKRQNRSENAVSLERSFFSV